MISCKIILKKEIAFGVYIIEIPKVFSFIPGQVISVGYDNIPPRMYSIASGINEKSIRILFDVKPEGMLTTRLALLKEGDNIMVSEPFGNFSCQSQNAFWIASGTGIAPYYSIYLSGETKNITIIHGGRHTSSFYFQSEFLTAKNLKYIRCCSQEQQEGIYPGRLTNYLKELNELPVDQMYYLCGSAEMVVESRDILISRGIPFDRISSEIYF